MLLDVDATVREIEAGSHSQKSKQAESPVQARLVAYAAAPTIIRWCASDEAMMGEYHVYDGPCPPWNDSLVHQYKLPCTRLM